MRKTVKRKKVALWIKILLASFCVEIILISVFFVHDTKLFGGYKLFLNRLVNSFLNGKIRNDTVEGRVVENEDFDKIDKNIPFKVPKPAWLPEGYELEFADYIEFHDEIYTIKYKYISDESIDQYIEFGIRNYGPPDKSGYTVEFEEILIGEFTAYVHEDENSESLTQAEYMNDRGIIVFIGGTIDKETLIKIIENMS